MIDILKIVGKKNYARLQKAGIASETKIKRLQPEQVMVLAGIGPKTAQKLFQRLGKKTGGIENVEKKYRKLKSKTRLKKIGAAVLSMTENPEPIKNVIERRRKEAHLWQNFLAHSYNFANPDQPRVPSIPYCPATITLDPTTMSYQKAKRRQMATYTIEKEEERFVLEFASHDMENNEDLGNNREFVWETSYNDRVELLILDHLKDEYTGFRQKTVDGMFVIIMTSGMEELAAKIKDIYKTDIETNIFAVAPSKQDYYAWEVVFKYYENQVVREIINRFDAFNEFYQYEDTLETAKKQIDYEMFAANNIESWWTLADNLKQSNVPFAEGKNFSAVFGIINGRLFGFEDHYSKEKFESDWIIPIPETYDEFVKVKKKGIINIKEFNLPIHILAMVNYTLDKDFDIWSSYTGRSLIFQSSKFPEWGFVITFN